MNVSKQTKTTLIVAASAIAVGAATFYFVKRKKTIVYEPQINPTTSNPNQLSLFDLEEYSETPKVISEGIIKHEASTKEMRKNYQKLEPKDTVEEKKEVEIVSVFKNDKNDTWDHEAELSSRTSEAPYIIHQEEFIEDEMGFHQETVTYYAQDDIMANQDDTPIYNYSGLMGELKFGHGSNDKNVVYIRNEQFRTEWEVLHHPGSFSYEVLGQQFEPGPNKQSVQKFRQE